MIKKKIGSPDLVIMFTNTVSHKMVNSASKKAGKKKIIKITAMATDGSNKKATIKIKLK